MSTVFIAVQCFQCSTMQVKQKKKCNNKWSCVVCNEKQSVRKVFSQGFMAKDVRKFVQSFNMSRQFVEQQQELQEETVLQEQTENQTKKKRTDWREYVDSDIKDIEIDDDQGELCEPNVVTEFPKTLLKKPKLRDNYSAAGLDYEDGEKLRKPIFRKRIAKKKIINPDKEPRTIVKENAKWVRENQLKPNHIDKEIGRSSKWKEYYETHDDDIGSSSVMTKLKRPVSKWKDFIDDNDDYLQLESKFQDINHAAFETKVCDEIVEDDVHPNFM